MKLRDDKVYLQHILEAIAKIELYMAGVSHEAFTQNSLVQDGVVRQLEIIGEASRNVSEELRAQYLAIPWRKIIGMRNRIIHAYFDVDLEVVWDTVKADLGDVKHHVLAMLNEPADTDQPEVEPPTAK